MCAPHRSSSGDSTTLDAIRKRVCKACDRCRMKKSKCDGSGPCSRCKADNAICVFGERKKSHDKAYPKGYVEMLEQQQSQLVCGLQEMYRRLRAADAWTGEALVEHNSQPLTHDILASMDLLETKHDGSGELEIFEEDLGKLQSKLFAHGAGRRASLSSDSEHSQSRASHGTPTLSRAALFKESSNVSTPASPLPPAQNPATGPRERRSVGNQFSPLQHRSPLQNDPRLFQAEWTYPEVTNPEVLFRPNHALQSPPLGQDLSSLRDSATWDSPSMHFDTQYNQMNSGLTTYPQHMYDRLGRMPEIAIASGTMDPMMVDADFSQFIQVMT